MLRPLEQWLDEDLCIEPRYTDPPKQKLLHAADVLCIDYYAACQRKKRANRWNNCHPQVGRSRQQAQKKNLLGFRVRAFGISNLASGRAMERSGVTDRICNRNLHALSSRLSLSLLSLLLLSLSSLSLSLQQKYLS